MAHDHRADFVRQHLDPRERAPESPELLESELARLEEDAARLSAELEGLGELKDLAASAEPRGIVSDAVLQPIVPGSLAKTASAGLPPGSGIPSPKTEGSANSPSPAPEKQAPSTSAPAAQAPEVRDASFSIEEKAGDILLTLVGRKGKGKEVKLEDIQRALRIQRATLAIPEPELKKHVFAANLKGIDLIDLRIAFLPKEKVKPAAKAPEAGEEKSAEGKAPDGTSSEAKAEDGKPSDGKKPTEGPAADGKNGEGPAGAKPGKTEDDPAKETTAPPEAPAPVALRNASFDVTKDEKTGKMTLIVLPPMGGGRPLDAREVLKDLRTRPLRLTGREAEIQMVINGANRKKTGEPATLDLGAPVDDVSAANVANQEIAKKEGLPPPGAAPEKAAAAKTPAKPEPPPVPDIDGFFEVVVSPDELSATLTLRARSGRGKPIEAHQVMAAIQKEQIVLAVPEGEIVTRVQQANEKGLPTEAWVLATGLAPVHGNNAVMKAAVPIRPFAELGLAPEPLAVPLLRKAERGGPVKIRQTVATIQLESLGVEGRTVRGKILVAEHGKNPYQVGENLAVKLVGKTQQLESQVDGVMLLEGPRIWALPRFDGRADLNIEADEMKATLTLTPHAGIGKPLVEADAFKALESERITWGLKKEVLDAEFRRFKQEGSRITMTIAEGTLPENGVDGRVDFHVKTEVDTRPKADAQGRIDWRIKENVIAVAKETHLATVIPPTKAGRAGQTIKGRVIAAKDGLLKELKAGSGVRSENREGGTVALVADLDGELTYDPKLKELRVSRSKTVESVNLDLGNVSFDGNLTVQKDIEDGMEVSVTGDLEVLGMIRSARVRVEGRLSCMGGILTKAAGWVKVRGELKARFIEQSVVEAGGDVIIERAIVASKVSTLGSVTLTGKKSVILGGRVQAKTSVEALDIGAASGAKTLLEVGMDFRKVNEYRELVAQLKNMKAQLVRVDLILDRLFQLTPKIEDFTPPMKLLYRQQLTAKTKMAADVQRTRERGQGLLKDVQQPLPALVTAFQTMNPGVQILMGTVTHPVDAPERAVQYFREEGNSAIQRRPAPPPPAPKTPEGKEGTAKSEKEKPA